MIARAARLALVTFLSACAPAHVEALTPVAAAPSAPPSASPSQPAVVALDLDSVTFEIGVAQTAQIFHVADQLSLWSPFMHRQYSRWAEKEQLLGPRERAALAAHRGLRHRRHYGVLDELFYTTLPTDAALARAAKVLPPADLAIERELFAALSPVILPLIVERETELFALRDRIVADEPMLASLLARAARFTGASIPRTHVPLWLVANPDPEQSGGGGFNGGQMVVEESLDARETLEHESLHFVLAHVRDQEELAAAACGHDLDAQTLDEGIAYAFYPGIVGRPHALDRWIAALVHDHRPASDPYVRYERLGRALTDDLRRALDENGALVPFLDVACARWKSLVNEPWP